jgi:transposase-like protein
MARPRGKIEAVCPNSDCRYFRRAKGKDIIKKGKNSSGTQMYFCLHCRKYFVETSDTPLYRKRLKRKQIEQMCKLLVEKNGIRAIHRITGLNKNTVSDWIEDLAVHAIQVQNFLVHDLGLSAYECDELWTTVKKTKRNLSVRALSGLDRVKSGYIHA